MGDTLSDRSCMACTFLVLAVLQLQPHIAAARFYYAKMAAVELKPKSSMTYASSALACMTSCEISWQKSGFAHQCVKPIYYHRRKAECFCQYVPDLSKPNSDPDLVRAKEI